MIKPRPHNFKKIDKRIILFLDIIIIPGVPQLLLFSSSNWFLNCMKAIFGCWLIVLLPATWCLIEEVISIIVIELEYIVLSCN